MHRILPGDKGTRGPGFRVGGGLCRDQLGGAGISEAAQGADRVGKWVGWVESRTSHKGSFMEATQRTVKQERELLQ